MNGFEVADGAPEHFTMPRFSQKPGSPPFPTPGLRKSILILRL